MRAQFKLVLTLLGLLVLWVSIVYADANDPTAVDQINRTFTSTYNNSLHPPVMMDAIAGNISELIISAKTQTQTWQGYYGNVTGTITLDDAFGWTMYDWYTIYPKGEIYASNGSIVDWGSIHCVNYTANTSIEINATTLDIMFGNEWNDIDNTRNTFNETGRLADGITGHDSFYVGIHPIANGSCPATNTYTQGVRFGLNENGYDNTLGDEWQQVLLTDNNSIIFTAILENRTHPGDNYPAGYDNRSHNFQMLVGDDGHGGDRTTTPYYFFVELT